jgi:hypothetical protein
VREAVVKYPSWSAAEKQAILSVMNALGSLHGTVTPLVFDFIAHYERTLAHARINPAFFELQKSQPSRSSPFQKSRVWQSTTPDVLKSLSC